ncbi:MAG: BrnT family toxin [Desulfobacterales bacterium]|nr:BrnT family toxin [Desulfobacterales bacterium]
MGLRGPCPTRCPHQSLPHSLLDNKLQHIYNVIMNLIGFSWDDRKNLANQKKHRVSFEEAQTVFFDEHAIEYDDPDHSDSEDRYLMLGNSYRIRVLVVNYTLRKKDTEIRIISARKATKKEQKAYFGEKL